MDAKSAQIKKELEERKKALKAELDKLESGLTDNFSEIQSNVSDTVDPRHWVQKHPLKVVAVAVLLGFVAGNRENPSVAGKVTMVGSVVAALKAYAARKAVDQIVHFVEDIGNRQGK
ncbi:MAG: hypothetical protein LAT52_07170 [Balneolales bacterium]|nr:hypothetical protein [Balneolales bacterium]